RDAGEVDHGYVASQPPRSTAMRSPTAGMLSELRAFRGGAVPQGRSGPEKAALRRVRLTAQRPFVRTGACMVALLGRGEDGLIPSPWRASAIRGGRGAEPERTPTGPKPAPSHRQHVRVGEPAAVSDPLELAHDQAQRLAAPRRLQLDRAPPGQVARAQLHRRERL